MTSILLITQIIIAVIITIAVLLQKSSSIGLGVYSGSNESLFGAKGPAGFMAKFTMIMGLLFIINTIALGYYYSKQMNKSVLDSTKVESSVPKLPTNNFDSNPLSSGKSPFDAPSAPLIPNQNKGN